MIPLLFGRFPALEPINIEGRRTSVPWDGGRMPGNGRVLEAGIGGMVTRLVTFCLLRLVWPRKSPGVSRAVETAYIRV